MRPVRATALCIARSFKAFALTGRQVTAPNNPGRCPGLRASAPSGRVGDRGISRTAYHKRRASAASGRVGDRVISKNRLSKDMIGQQLL